MELKGRPHLTVVRTFVISDVTKIGFKDMDFGWRKAAYGGPGGDGAMLGLLSFLIQVRNINGVDGILVPVCLPSAVMRRFEAEIKEATENTPPFLLSFL